MKKKISECLTVLAFVLAAAAAIVCFARKDAVPALLFTPEAAVERTRAMADSIGDYEALGAMLYGSPDLGVHREPGDEVGRLFWNGFLESLDCSFTGDCYATDRGLARDLKLTRLSFEAVTGRLGETSRQILEQMVQQAGDMSEVYNEDNEYREDVVMEAVRLAAEEILAEEDCTETLELTVNLVYDGGQWWIVPDQSLLNALSWGS